MAVNEPVQTTVPWDHKDEELRLIIACQFLAEKSLTSDDQLARVFGYLSRRFSEEAQCRTRNTAAS